MVPRTPACASHECNAEAAGPVADRDGRTHAGTRKGIQRATKDGETKLAGPGPLPGNRPATRSADRATSPRPGPRPRRRLRALSFPGPIRHAHPWLRGPALPAAPELRTIGLVCQSRPVPGAVRRISRSEPTGCDGRHAGREKRTVLATPRRCEDRHADARSRRS